MNSEGRSPGRRRGRRNRGCAHRRRARRRCRKPNMGGGTPRGPMPRIIVGQPIVVVLAPATMAQVEMRKFSGNRAGLRCAQREQEQREQCGSHPCVPPTIEYWLPCRSSWIGRGARESRILYRRPRRLPYFLQISRCPPCALRMGSGQWTLESTPITTYDVLGTPAATACRLDHRSQNNSREEDSC